MKKLVNLQVPVRGCSCVDEPLPGCRLKCPHLGGIIVVVIVIIILMVMVFTMV